MRLFLFIFLSSLSTTSWAQNCLTHISDVDFIMASKKAGSYRWVQDNTVDKFDLTSLPEFSRYLAYARQVINARNPRASWLCPINTRTVRLLQTQNQLGDTLQVVDLLSPFELKRADSNKVALLFHGLTDSPFSYHSLAAFFYEQGYNVRTVLLPGHGTAASDLQETDFEQWQAITHYAISRTSKDYDEIVVGGYSTGAALAIAHLAENPVPKQVKAMMLWSPATEPHNKNGWLSKWVDLIPFVNWIDEDADIDFAKYESFAFAAATLAHEAMRRIKADKLAKKTLPNIPLFIAQSDVDTTIDATATLALAGAWYNPEKRPKTRNNLLVYYGDKRTATQALSEHYPIVNYQCQQGIPPCNNIIDLSHISVINSPQHPYYGELGQYRNCGSYLDDDALYKRCKTAPHVLVGERTAANLDKGVLKRLTYNPFFSELEQDMRRFLAQLE
ncbi:alpha/beta hydrolase [Pseudoalteromonas sp. SSDWG2]|uniref:alpha/beta hydrolase n=1 Tax=Pseudoalteromonas sp. SSDWG2 TaxID=3139391 RepID=UPI003BADA11C